MKSKLLQLRKVLLVAAGLLVGASAWASETTTTHDFNDQTTPFVIPDADRIYVVYETYENESTDYYAKYVSGNMNAVAFAYYDFSSAVKNAYKVTVEFDFNIATVAGHELISIADANYHTLSDGGFTGKSNTGYGNNGAIFNLGCYRVGSGDNATNKFAINSTQNDLAGLDVWCHAKVEVSNMEKTVNYIITDANGETLVAADNVGWLNVNAQSCTQLDIYIGTSYSPSVMVDNVSITSYVNESTHSYTINAIDNDGQTISLLASGMASEGSAYGTIVPKVVKSGDNYYVLSDESLINYGAFYTMEDKDVTKEITYTLDEEIVYYLEGGEAGDNAAYSTGNVGQLATQNATGRGYAVGALSIGNYEMESYFTEREGYGLALRDYYDASNTKYDYANIVCHLTGAANTVLTKAFVVKKPLSTSCINSADQNGKTALSAKFDYVIIRKKSDIVNESITIGEAGWATFYGEGALDFSGTGLTAYIATYNEESKTVTLTKVDDVPANTGVVLQGAEGPYTIPVIANPSNATQGDMSGSTTEDVAYNKFVDDGKDMYVLSLNSDKTKVQFRRLTSGSSAKGKAYLLLPSALKDEPNRVLSVVFGDDTTGINEAIVNGEQKAAGTYNLNGQRVAQPTKGLYIVNGKKVIIK